MISVGDYKKFLIRFDEQWSTQYRPFGIHFCGKDPERYAEIFSKLDHLAFVDVGWGGDAGKLREHLPKTFLNIRLSPVELIEQSTDEIEGVIRRLVADSGDPRLTGVCCINMDEKVTDDKITCMFETVAGFRAEHAERGTD
jgi:hypothetical protein